MWSGRVKKEGNIEGARVRWRRRKGFRGAGKRETRRHRDADANRDTELKVLAAGGEGGGAAVVLGA